MGWSPLPELSCGAGASEGAFVRSVGLIGNAGVAPTYVFLADSFTIPAMVRLPGPGDVPPVTFRNFVTELASTALVCLGEIRSPVTGQKTADLPRAEHVVGLLEMLALKTDGNLNEHEQEYLVAALTDLQEKLRRAKESA